MKNKDNNARRAAKPVHNTKVMNEKCVMITDLRLTKMNSNQHIIVSYPFHRTFTIP